MGKLIKISEPKKDYTRSEIMQELIEMDKRRAIKAIKKYNQKIKLKKYDSQRNII